MLTRLDISNYALIENVNLKFDKGFTAITGETGAGKSILLKALNLLLGDRADSTVLKQSEKKCYLEAEFDIKALDIREYFSQNDLDYDELTILRREFSPSGKSRCFVNDSPVSLSALKELGERMIAVHAQHQILALFDNDFQVDVIDHFSGIIAQTKEYRRKFEDYRRKAIELADLQEKDRESRKEKDYLDFLLNELKQANLENLDPEELQSQISRIENAEKISGNLELARSVFENETYGPLTAIKTLIDTFKDLKQYDTRFAEIHERLQSSKIELEDISAEIDNYSGELEMSPAEMQIIRDKNDLLNSLCFKHNLNNIQELVALKDKITDQLGDIDNLELQIQSLEKQIGHLKSELGTEAEKISQFRQQHIPELEKTISILLDDLAMPDAELKIELTNKEKPGPRGIDQIEFLFRTNLGGGFLPVKKIASGGELSRLMLAVLSVLSETKQLPTLIFDEIDTGVSGEVASKIATVFNRMGKRMQLIAITHLPQVAGKAHQHLHVFKDTQDGKAMTFVKVLSGDERIEELAKMISGEKVTSAARENAVHLLNNS